MILGILLVLAAGAITGYQFWTQHKAGENAQLALEALEVPAPTEQPDDSKAEQVPHYVLNPDMGMPEKVVDGIAYVGMLEIPALSCSFLSSAPQPRIICRLPPVGSPAPLT